MSLETIGAVWLIPFYPPSVKLVALHLADAADETGQSWHSFESIARRCGLTRQSVKLIVRKLREEGWIIREDRFRQNGSMTSSILRWDFAKLDREVAKARAEAATVKARPRGEPPEADGDGGGRGNPLPPQAKSGASKAGVGGNPLPPHPQKATEKRKPASKLAETKVKGAKKGGGGRGIPLPPPGVSHYPPSNRKREPYKKSLKTLQHAAGQEARAESPELRLFVQAFAAVYEARFRSPYVPHPKHDIEAARVLLVAGITVERAKQLFEAATKVKGFWSTKTASLPQLAAKWNEVQAEVAKHTEDKSAADGGQTAAEWAAEIGSVPVGGG